MALWVVRHGRTEANAAGRLQGRLDLPIDEVGRAQVAALPSLVPNVDRVISSPLLRARQTAEVFGVDATVDERWIEVSYGEYEGVPMSEISPAVWKRWVDDPHFTPEGGESLHALGVRVSEACDELVDEMRTRDVVVVTHATPVKVAMAWALGVDVRITWRSFVNQASVTRIAIGERGPSLTAFNVQAP